MLFSNFGFSSYLHSGLLALRAFSTSSAAFQLHNHRLYPKINWDNIEAGQYAVVDPVNPGSILYLSEQDYIVMIRVSLTTNKTLKVLATPGDSPISPSGKDGPKSQNSPPSTEPNHPFLDGLTAGLQSKLNQKQARKRLRHYFTSWFRQFIPKGKKSEATNPGSNEGLREVSMIKLERGNTLRWFTNWFNQINWWTRGKLPTTVAVTERDSFGRSLVKLISNNGPMFLIRYFKIALFVVNSFLGGTKLTTTQPLGMRIRLINGLPAFLPLFARNGIRQGNRHFIHTWVSVFNSYKAMLGTHVEPYIWDSTITVVHPGFRDNVVFADFQSNFAQLFANMIKFDLRKGNPNLTIKNLFFSLHAGPNHQNAVLGSGVDARVWASMPRNLILEWLRLTGQTDLARKFREIGKMSSILDHVLHSFEGTGITPLTSLFGLGREGRTGPSQNHPKVGPVEIGHSLMNEKFDELYRFGILGRLAVLYEAAGKVRIVAIVDYWTNAVLKPLHDWIFSILRLLPQDATFDQDGRCTEFANRGYTDLWSLDLKSATDLIPLPVYRALLSWLLPEKVVSLWLELLVDRDFQVPASLARGYPDRERFVRYGTGQPMGALTSWGLLALSHHAIVLYAALLVRATTPSTMLSFKDYLVLGDDVVIAHQEVAERYQQIMLSFGIPVGLAKSYISSDGMFNFANKSFSKEINISPISLKEEVGVQSLASRAEMAMRMVRMGWVEGITTSSWLAPVIKLFVTPREWTDIQKDLKSGITHPLVSWILSVLLVPGSARFAETILPKVSISSYLAAMLRKAVIWNKPIGSLDSLINENRSEPLILSILQKWVDRIYKEFLDGRQRLASFQPWMEMTLEAELDYVLQRIFLEQKSKLVARWQANHRMYLKELQVMLRLNAFKIKHVELVAEQSLLEITQRVALAEKDLPRVPDFTGMDLNGLIGGLMGGSNLRSSEERQVLALHRMSNLLHLVDDIGSLATPGVSSALDRLNETSPDLTSPNEEAK